MSVHIPKRIRQNWFINAASTMNAVYKHDQCKRIFKFAFQPETEELLFDIAPTHHDIMILNNGKKKFDAYVRGICFWDKRVIYLRGHTREDWLTETKKMLRNNGVPNNFRVIWGQAAAVELEKGLIGL